MHTQWINPILNFVLMFALAFSGLGGTPATASALPEVPASSALSVATLLNPDGTLNIRPGANGVLDLNGWNVTLDAERGPILAPSAPAAVGWSIFGSGMDLNEKVYAIAIRGTDVFVGGAFNMWSVCHGCSDIAKWDGGTWSALGEGIDGMVFALAIMGTDLYAGGIFSKAGTCDAMDGCNRIAKWDGSTWSPLGNGVGNYVTTIAVSGTNLIVGGGFTSAWTCPDTNLCNYIAKWNGSAWSSLGTGMNGVVGTIAISGTDVFAGGAFTSAGGVANTNHIAKWNGSTWSALGSGTNDAVSALVTSGTDLYAGGAFTSAGGVANTNHIAKWDGSTWSALDTGINGTVLELAVSGTDVIAGGDFTRAGTCASADGCNYIAKWNGSSWSALGAGLDRAVLALVVNGTEVIASGHYGGSCFVDCKFLVRYGDMSPTLAHITPNAGSVAGGKRIVLAGARLIGGSVTFDGLAASCTVNSATQITCFTPPHAIAAVDVVVTTPNGVFTAAGGFRYARQYVLPIVTR